jgi:uncharacterized protein (UPF0335 family)
MSGNDKPLPDLSEVFDLKRNKSVRDYVHRFQELYQQRDAVSADIKELAVECKEHLFSPVEIKAMQDVAKWKKDDRGNAAAGRIAALRRVSSAVKYDLFSWADRDREDLGR